jgi:hypothetical protein
MSEIKAILLASMSKRCSILGSNATCGMGYVSSMRALRRFALVLSVGQLAASPHARPAASARVVAAAIRARVEARFLNRI